MRQVEASQESRSRQGLNQRTALGQVNRRYPHRPARNRSFADHEKTRAIYHVRAGLSFAIETLAANDGSGQQLIWKQLPQSRVQLTMANLAPIEKVHHRHARGAGRNSCWGGGGFLNRRSLNAGTYHPLHRHRDHPDEGSHAEGRGEPFEQRANAEAALFHGGSLALLTPEVNVILKAPLLGRWESREAASVPG